MCDFFWLSSADQGDLSDVVRASLQPPLRAVATTPPATVCGDGHVSLSLPEEGDEWLLLQGGIVNRGGGNHDDELHLQQQPVRGGDGMGVMVISDGGGGSCDPVLLSPPPPYPGAPQALVQPEGLIRHIISGAPRVEREDDVAAIAPEMDEHALEMAMAAPHPHAPAVKRRKSQTKKVVCIPAPTAAPPGMGGRPSTSGGEVVPSDLWAWRKYGQKPIKGSPYPRGYYRCSSSKGCSARKQVERSRTDPSMLVITYTSDHNHPWPTQRNALAGSTRPPSSSSSSSSSAAAKSHHRQQHPSSTAAAAPPPPPPPPTPHRHHADNVVVGNNVTPISIGGDHRHPLLKQEAPDMDDHHKPEQDVAAADHDLDMFADMDGVLSASSFNSRKQQQHATAADDYHLEKLPEEDDKQQQLLDPFRFSFFDWVGASFGIEEAANNGG
ncbi:hypothetical protein ACP70R_019706 [Stipagrostis hirtigluma subsp. patula]